MNTIESLKQLGFTKDSDDIRLVYDFGNFELMAYESMNRLFVPVIYLTGVYHDGRTLCDIQLQLPLHVSSTEQTAAFIASGIERHLKKDFKPLIQIDWLEIGRNNYDLLPWVKEQKQREEELRIYNQRPKCLVERDWLKLALRELKSLIDQLEAKELISVTFRDGVFSFRSQTKTIAFPAIGNDWQEEYQISSFNFSRFPKRLNNKEIEIAIWNDSLRIGHWHYPLKTNISLF